MTETIKVMIGGAIGFDIAKAQVDAAVAGAVDAVGAARTDAVGAIAADKAGALADIATDRGAALTDISSARTDITADRSAALTALADARTSAIQAITMAGNPASSALKAAYVDSLPLGPVPMRATTNNPLNISAAWDGAKIVLDRSPYACIDFERDASLTVLQRYVDYSGSDANAGTSVAPWKTLEFALAQVAGQNMVINLIGNVGYLSLDLNSIDITGRVKIKGVAGSRPMIAAMRETYDLAHFAWQTTANAGVYKSVTGTKYFKAMYDSKYKDSDGVPYAMTGVASEAACAALAGSWHWDATAGALYVHMVDKRVPDPATGWLYSEPARMSARIRLTGSPATGAVLFENVSILINSGPQGSVGTIFVGPVTAGAEGQYNFGLKNVDILGATSRGILVYDPKIAVVEDVVVDRSTNDAVSIQSYRSAAAGGAVGSTFYFHNITARNCAPTNWLNQEDISAQPSINLFTAHMGAHGWLFNCFGYGCNGAAVGMVNGCKVGAYNVHVGKPNMRGGNTYNIGFWHDNSLGPVSDGYLDLWGCSTSDDGDPTMKLISNVAQSGATVGKIRVKAWRGQTIGAVVGTLEDWAGNPLPAA